MRKSNFKTRLIAVLLTLCIALTLMPTSSFAAGANEITTVDIGNIWKELDATQPVAFTAEVNSNNEECYGKMTIAEEQWIPISEGGSVIKSTDSNAPNPEAGVDYLYSVTLQAKEGYVFSSAFNEVQEAEDNSAVHGILDGVEYGINGDYRLKVTVSEDGKTLTMSIDLFVTATAGSWKDDYVINHVVINNAPTSCTVGEAPKAMATKGDTGAYTFYEYWEEWAQTDNGMEPVKFWYSNKDVSADQRITAFEEGKTYSYSIIAKANENYTFASIDNLSVMLNDEDYTDKSGVILDGTGLMIGPGKFMKPTKPITQKEIPVVEINNATLTFKDGDKPGFTGTIPTNAKYRLVFEEWRTNGEWTRSEEWYNDADHHGSDKVITAFDKNKSYTYILYLTPNAAGSEEDWYFGPNTKLRINGKEVSYEYDNAEYDKYNFGVRTGIKMTPTGNTDTKIIKMKESNIILSATSYTYNGKVKKPSVTVKDDKGNKISAANYIVSYEKGCKNVGTYAVTVKFKGNYNGTVKKTFTIKPKPTSISKLTAGRKKFTVKWKKQATQTTGYQVQYSTSSKFKNAKTVTVSKNKTTGKTVSKLKPKKKYYVRIRTYKTVKASGKSIKIYSSWSKVKTVKVK
ncbi:MAG: fibronectin type III domain-containing protein [Anaerobutyricum sp.]|nr:fibronectin type III domain-containing protein [Anaerobutyricum sp.]